MGWLIKKRDLVYVLDILRLNRGNLYGVHSLPDSEEDIGRVCSGDCFYYPGLYYGRAISGKTFGWAG